MHQKRNCHYCPFKTETALLLTLNGWVSCCGGGVVVCKCDYSRYEIKMGLFLHRQESKKQS